ncbi:protein PFC0760c-like [Helianthus annuus]|uniref:protein PFC0760c-like n=1 Tax=Helianthus annuus TaxID=4232 RepID=UPI000B907954|nr:protein PFC0760c-like [Helianthus annuus]
MQIVVRDEDDGDDVENEDEDNVYKVDEHDDEFDDDDDDDDHDDHYNYELQNAMHFNDDEEASLQRMVNEDIESRETMFEVSASGNHALIREVTQYDNIFAEEEQQNKEPEEEMADKLDGAYKELEDCYNKMSTLLKQLKTEYPNSLLEMKINKKGKRRRLKKKTPLKSKQFMKTPKNLKMKNTERKDAKMKKKEEEEEGEWEGNGEGDGEREGKGEREGEGERKGEGDTRDGAIEKNAEPSTATTAPIYDDDEDTTSSDEDVNEKDIERWSCDFKTLEYHISRYNGEKIIKRNIAEILELLRQDLKQMIDIKEGIDNSKMVDEAIKAIKKHLQPAEETPKMPLFDKTPNITTKETKDSQAFNTEKEKTEGDMVNKSVDQEGAVFDKTPYEQPPTTSGKNLLKSFEEEETPNKP